jgi:drug/metabolite transporter (DMT)-like permease
VFTAQPPSDNVLRVRINRERMFIGVYFMTSTSRAVTLRLVAGFLFVLMAVIVRYLSAILPLGEVVFARSFVALLALLLVFSWQGSFKSAVTTAKPSTHLFRGAVGFTAMALNFLALRYLPVSEAQALNYLSPLFVTLISVVFLGELVGSVRCLSVVVGFAGAILIAQPTLSMTAPVPFIGVAIAIAGAFLMAVAMLQIAKLAKTESTSTIAFYFALFGSVFSITSIGTDWIVPTGLVGLALLTLGLLGAAAHMCMTAALGMASPSMLAPLEYVNVVWALLLGLVAFGEMPSTTSIFGIALISGAALMVALTPAKRGRYIHAQKKS